jgi:hypothetical protein
MGMAPVFAVPKLLQRSGSASTTSAVGAQRAFAVQVLYCQTLGIRTSG